MMKTRRSPAAYLFGGLAYYLLIPLLLCFLMATGWADGPLENLLQSMLANGADSWDRLVVAAEGIRENQFVPAFEKAKTLLAEGKAEQAWAWVEALDYVEFVQAGKLEYRGRAQSSLARLLEKSGNVEEAGRQYARVAKLHPESARAQLNLAAHCIRTGKLTLAKPSLDKTLELNPKLAEAHLWYGQYHLVNKEMDAALVSFKRVLEIEPNYPLAQDMVRGLTGSGPSVATSKSPEAQKHFEAAEALFAKGNYKAALTEYSAACTSDPNFAKAKLYMGDCYQKLGQRDQCIQCYREATLLDPNDRQAFRFLGDALETRFDETKNGQDLTEAIAAYQRALQIDPNYSMARSDLERAQKKRP